MAYRIGIDAHALDGKKQGIQTFIRQLFGAVTSLDKRNEYFFYCYEPDHHSIEFSGENIHFRKLKSSSSVCRLLFEFPLAFRRDRIDVGVFQYTSPPFSSARTILVVHDILPISHPEFFPKLFSLRYALFTRLSMATASAIVTVSTASQEQIHKLRRYPRQRVHMLRQGPSFEASEMLSEVDSSSLKLPAGLEYGTYILAVGRIERRKNIDLLIRAFVRANIANIQLVIVGRQDLGYALESPNDPRIIFLDSIEDNQLMNLYRGAGLFVFPSIAEGFGLPVLDAVLFGLPVLSSNLTSMPGVAGSLAIYFDPTEKDAENNLADRIQQHFTQSQIIRPTKEERIAHAQKHSWNAGATDFLKVLETTLPPRQHTS